MDDVEFNWDLDIGVTVHVSAEQRGADVLMGFSTPVSDRADAILVAIAHESDQIEEHAQILLDEKRVCEIDMKRRGA